MKTLKVTLTPEQRIQLAYAATLEIDLPDYDQLANELQSAKTSLEAIKAILNPSGYTGLSLPELLQQRLAEAACDGFNAGFRASSSDFNAEFAFIMHVGTQRFCETRDSWVMDKYHKKAAK